MRYGIDILLMVASIEPRLTIDSNPCVHMLGDELFIAYLNKRIRIEFPSGRRLQYANAYLLMEELRGKWCR